MNFTTPIIAGVIKLILEYTQKDNKQKQRLLGKMNPIFCGLDSICVAIVAIDAPTGDRSFV
ncbi:hypothetical protein BpHYR1_006646 [Brachionus plicatilis]|uniref:Uncharacterized protein n=1 Tax=Brachionus plicatilis TaxID=10195 RepID=A0A3M7P1M8_BRAPC|nr:hypothetical protein BpHYR1_006646 [Brachionus plicatilis]